jgi:hypothetical protein
MPCPACFPAQAPAVHGLHDNSHTPRNHVVRFHGDNPHCRKPPDSNRPHRKGPRPSHVRPTRKPARMPRVPAPLRTRRQCTSKAGAWQRPQGGRGRGGGGRSCRGSVVSRS